MGDREGFKYIVRIAGTDIDGSLKLAWGLSSIKGIGMATAMAIIRVLGLDPDMRVGYLTDEQAKRIDQAVQNLARLGLPSWMYNRRKDYETGEDKHLIGSELVFYARRDVEREIKIKSYRGIRHSLGLKVRGQRTRTTGRLGMTVGVRKKR